MTQKSDTAILELLASKICHDLISPIGAVNNGIEFLQEMGSDAGPDVTELIAFSAGQASSKLKAYRIAYGSGGADSNLKPEDVYKTLEPLFAGDGKFTQDWSHKDLTMDEYPRAYCKILICLFLLAVECLPKGGKVSATLGADGATHVCASNDHVLYKDAMEDALTLKTPLDKLDTRYVHAYMTGMMASNYGYNISISQKSDKLVEFTFKNAA